jgi:hypothetical protein
MRTLFAIIATLAWALWLGGSVALFIFVIVLFRADREIARQAAPLLFLVFEKYQIALGATGIVAGAGWWVGTRSRWVMYWIALLLIASIGTVVTPMLITSRMEELRRSERTATPEYQALHKRSEWVYMAQTALLACAGLVLPLAMRGDGPAARVEDESDVGK